MSQLFVADVGAVFSADIAVPNPEREVRFYSRVLTTGENPLWREGDLLNNLGMPIVGLGALTPEYADLPLQWMPHIQVADVGSSVERAVQYGGRILMHSRDDVGNSQWAVLLDPNGAAFGVIPVVAADHTSEPDRASAESASRVGRIMWLDLTVPDAATTRDFYRHVVQWTVQNVQMKDGDTHYADYNMMSAAGSPAAGICHARGGNAGLPPVWMIYLPVGDLAESVRRVKQGGGTVLKKVRNADGKHAYAAIRDPVGAALALTQA